MAFEKKKTMFYPVSTYLYNGDLCEQVYEPKKKQTYFLRYNKKNDEVIIMNEIEESNKKYVPIIDDLLHKQVVLLPERTVEYTSEDELEEDISIFIKTWLDVSEEHLQKATWYVMLTWVSDNLHTLPYLRALGDYGTGKTRYLDVIGGICYKPMYVGGAVRSAPIYRVIDKWRGTAIFDEFTLNKSDETEDIIQILNNGYQRGKPVLRCQEGTNKVVAFDPFGAKILATRSTFKDKALESRCITEILRVTSRKDLPIDLTESFFNKRDELQGKLLLYRFRNWDIMKRDESIPVDFGNIIPRIKQSLSPFVVLFQYNQERLKKFIEYTHEYNKQIVEENATSFDGQIINAYLELLNKHDAMQDTLDDYNHPHITSSDIRLHLIEEGWKEDSVNANTIGRHLKALGFVATPTKVNGRTKKILSIDEDLLVNLSSRYVVTAVTEVSNPRGVLYKNIYQYENKTPGGKDA